jgi:hypothetical protein
MGLGAVKHIPSFINIGPSIQELLEGINIETYIHTDSRMTS